MNGPLRGDVEQAAAPVPLRLVLPLPPRLTNSSKGRSRHWRALHKEKVAYWTALDSALLQRLVPRPPRAPMERAEIQATLYLWNAMDDGNAMARMKWVEDWLVRTGYLVNDSRKHLKWAGIPEQVIDRKRPRVELVISALTTS